MKNDLTKSDIDRLWELRDYGPAVRNTGRGWKLNGMNRRPEGMELLVHFGYARVLGVGRKAEIYITDAGRARLAS